ncbi:MAG: histidine kinase [Bacteroidota bacterium]
MANPFFSRRRLIRMAIVLSPIMAVASMTPILILKDNLSGPFIQSHFNSWSGIIEIFLRLTMIIGFQWAINIWLFTRKKARESERIIHLNYLWSYVLATLHVTVPVFVLGFEIPKFEEVIAGLRFYPVFGALANNTLILLFISLALSRSKSAQLEVANLELSLSNLRAQQEQLKHQLQPHFLFNALYTLQLLIKKEPQAAEKYLQRLSNFLRTSLQHAKQDQISVADEIAFCRDYLELQKVRFAGALQYEIDIPAEVQNKNLIPIFSLQLLAENAIKHNGFTRQKPLHFSISQDQPGRIKVANNHIPKMEQEASFGIGLQNLADRFKLLGFGLPQVNTQDDSFTVHLPIAPL